MYSAPTSYTPLEVGDRPINQSGAELFFTPGRGKTFGGAQGKHFGHMETFRTEEAPSGTRRGLPLQ